MKSAQKQQSVQKQQVQEEEDFEIKDFRETLTKCIEDQDQVYGHKYKPRAQEPSMFDILSWKDDDEAISNYTKNDRYVVEANIANNLKYKINKASSHWVTENMDQFRKFTYSPSKKVAFFDIDDPSKAHRPGTAHTVVVPQVSGHVGKSPKDNSVYVKNLPAKSSETLDKYTIQDIKNMKDVLKRIESRALNKGGEVINNPIAYQLTDHQGYCDDEEEELRRAGVNGEDQDENEEEEESEDIQVEKTDYSNIQSRLLKTTKKAKELDPVYEKDRLGRRQERIKKLNETTRWLPNTAFKTYFGKAPFENYGRGNVNPTVGGPIYGDYMKSHNVGPHSGGNKPEYKQIYEHADFVSTRYPESQPEPPRKCKDEIRLSQKQVDELKRRNPLTAEKFTEAPKTIHKPDLVNSLRFASEENTPDNSFEEEQEKKSKNLGDSLKQLNKKARVIRGAGQHSELELIKKGKGKSDKKKKQQKLFQETQEKIREQLKAESTKKSAAKTEPQSEGKKVKTQSKTNNADGRRSKDNEEDIAAEFDYANEKNRKSRAENEQQQTQQKGRANSSQGVRDLMQDPPSAFVEKSKDKKAQTIQAPINEKSPKVSFKQAPENKSAVKSKEAPVQQNQQSQSAQKQKVEHNYGKVEGLNTLLKDAQKNEKLWNKANEDMNGTLSVNPMEPPKDYLFSLSQKETDPRYYKNVPAVWLNRIPYAGRKTEKSDDIRGVFAGSD